MSNKKQSSVEYIIEMIRLNDKDFYATLLEDEVFSKAIAMHKEEHRKTWIQSVMSKYKTFEHYYNETFGGDNE